MFAKVEVVNGKPVPKVADLRKLAGPKVVPKWSVAKERQKYFS